MESRPFFFPSSSSLTEPFASAVEAAAWFLLFENRTQKNRTPREWTEMRKILEKKTQEGG